MAPAALHYSTKSQAPSGRAAPAPVRNSVRLRLNSTPHTPDIFTVYDALGRKVSESNGRAVYGFEYSDANLALSKETIAYDLDNDSQADDFSRVIERTQDSKLRNTGWVLNNGTSTPDNEVIYAYGAEDGRLSSVSDGSHTFSYVYTDKSANLLAGWW